MQELAKSLEALGLTTLEGLTKKDLKKVRVDFDHYFVQSGFCRAFGPGHIFHVGVRGLCVTEHEEYINCFLNVSLTHLHKGFKHIENTKESNSGTSSW